MFGIISLLEPKMLYFGLAITVLMLFILFKNFGTDNIGDRREKRRFRIIIAVTRIIMIGCLALALAKPFGEVTSTTPGNPKITILIDNSTSMEVLETSFMPKLKEQLEKQFPVTIKKISSGTKSDLGDQVLTYLEKDSNLLLITDGNTNYGTSFEDAVMLAANLNSTLSAIALDNKEDEVGVYITGADSSVGGVNNTYTVHITKLGIQQATLKVVVDNEEIFNQPTELAQFAFQRTFEEGDHKITAEITSAKDHFQQNNKFFKAVSIVKKPKILLVENTQDPVELIFNELYEVTKLNYIPENVNDYYAVILNDMPANIKGMEYLADYLIDKDGGYYGNGLFVIGGYDSFDKGNYKSSMLETYLPVYVGKAAKQRGSSNIAIAIDFSGTTGERYEIVRDPSTGKIKELRKDTSNIQDVNKALAISIINTLGPDNKVGVSIFSTQSATVQELKPLFKIKKELIDKISRVQQPAGQSYFQLGLTGAYLLLKDNIGSNNIILVTDGQTGSDPIRQQTIDTAKTLNERGVKVYTVGTGRNVDEEFLKDVAYNGGGIYFPASQENSLRILFGEPEESKFGEVFDLFILNPYHYITQGIELDASLYGYNQVIPKSNAISLITTQHGEPALTIWNYGLGRVATLNVFSGNNNLGDILNKKNSIILTRATNWAIGDPQRKEPYYIIIKDARANGNIDIIVKSEKYPSSELKFTKTGENQYKATLTAKETGFGQILNKNYAVNYEQEYQYLGMSESLEQETAMTGGRIFSPSDPEEIAKFVKSVSKRTKVERTTIIWPFLLGAAIMLLIEIILRKIREYRLNG